MEPSLYSYYKLRLNHIFHPKVKCVHSAISAQNGHIFLKEEGYESTLSHVTNNRIKDAVRIKSLTFDSLISKYPIFKNIDLLSIDVEGHELNILSNIKDNDFNAKIIVIETDKSNNNEVQSLEFFNNITLLHQWIKCFLQ